MWRKKFWLFIILGCLIIGLMYINRLRQPVTKLQYQKLTFNAQDRILILAPHPDDEVLGCGGIIQKAVKLKLPLRIVFFTYGDNNQWSFLVYRKRPVVMPRAVQTMGLVRHDEAIAAARALGVWPEQLTFLGYPDFRTLNIWCFHWSSSPPAKGMLTEVKAVPYANAYRPGAAYKGEEILKDLETILLEFKPTKIFVSHPGDHNGDHRSLYLFTRVALWNLEKEIKAVLYPYLIHYKQWPLPRGYHPEVQLNPPELFKQQIHQWYSNNLERAEVERKHTAIKKHSSQYYSSAKYLLSFMRANELFGDFPVIVLKPNVSEVFLSSEHKKDFVEFSEQLTAEERASFVGLEERSVSLEDNDIVLSIKLSRPVAGTVGVSVYIFGYRKDKQFQDMPKLHIRFGAVEHKIFDQKQILPVDVVKIKRRLKEITVRVPLDLLGSPQFVLTSANTYLGAVPLDWVSWRMLYISNSEAEKEE